MIQEDIFTLFFDSLRSVFSSPAFRNLLFYGFTGLCFINCARWFIRLMCFPSRFKRPEQAKKEPSCAAEKEPSCAAEKEPSCAAEKEPSCAFHCDCVDCISYESKKYCSRCDRFQICAYCSSREHCEL